MGEWNSNQLSDSGFLRTSLNIGVKISFLPACVSASAAVSNTLWTSVDP